MFEYFYENNYICIMHVIVLRKVYSEYMIYIYINLKSLAKNLIGMDARPPNDTVKRSSVIW